MIPDPGISIYEFTGGMYQGGCTDCGPKPDQPDVDGDAGDPVNLATGLFKYDKTDLYVADGVMPIELTRHYRPGDTVSRAFGLGTNHPYDMYIVGTKYIDLNLILGSGESFYYV